MAQESKPLLALLLCLSLVITKGNCVCTGCTNAQVAIIQLLGETNRFTAKVTNLCCCDVRNVVVFAPGFESDVPVDPKLFRRSPGWKKNYYLVGDGNTIPANETVTFHYVWHTMIKMKVVGLTVSNCLLD
uniref:Uncharacterized protein n=1 Tax=Leersia perrieri TaxID=77586 RepID=A0A0D9XZ58_9ORYZ